jgi:inward rectifier potassium channel
MTVHWPLFFGSAAALFVVLNAVFGFLYSLGHEPIANAAENGPLAYFYFSIETLATVGYGDMHPQTNYAHLIATIEIFTGMCFLAVMTGLIFARFSRPRARFVFANNAVITRHEGRQTLMIRMANARHNMIWRANARLWIIRAERTKEGDQLRRFYELKLDRSDHPIFILSWMLFHVIDKDSPLHGLTASDLTESTLLVLNAGGIDDSSVNSSMRVTSIHGAISAGSIVTRTSPACRRRVVSYLTTLNSTTRYQRSSVVALRAAAARIGFCSRRPTAPDCGMSATSVAPDLNMIHCPGSAGALNDVITGRVPVMMQTIVPVAGIVASGEI